LIRGPWITASYYNDNRTRESFEDGFWKSGDAGSIDENGYLKITDRFKDIIKSGGEWISSIDLENALMAHPDVREATVVGIEHPKWEERPLALVVLADKAKGKTEESDLINFISSGFAKWQLPDKIIFVDKIPKTSVGKFSKKEVRETYKEFYT
jgi:fatty-acyl-CoA synthase